MDFNSVEIKKLIEYAYYLHKDEMEYYCKFDNGTRSDGVQYVPICEDNITGYPTKKLDRGIVCGYYTKEYGHSSAIPSLSLDVVIGTYIENGFIYDDAIRLHLDGSLSNKTLDERKLYYLLYKVDLEECEQNEFPIIKGGKKHRLFGYDDSIPRLVISGGYGDFDDDNEFDQKSDDEKQALFIKVMVTLGFRKEDVIAVFNGKMKAEAAFKNVAPENKIHTKVLYWNCRKYTFEDNTLIDITPMDIEVSADIGQCLDDIPFPFDGPAIIDAAQVNTYGIDFGENAKGHRLINVNSKKYSIYEANLTNAVIDEIIDLAKVDATQTRFGHQKVANVNNAIGNLSHTRFPYAVDEQNQKFAVDDYGFLLTYEKREENVPIFSQSMLSVLSEASSYEAAAQGLNNGAQGIGLVRTEDMLRINGKAVYENIFITKDEDVRNRLINLCYDIQKEKMVQILEVARGQKVVFRLLDAKLGEILPQEQIDTYFYCEQDLRGIAALFKYPAFLESQVRAILTSALETGAKAYVLVPLNDSTDYIKNVKEIFQKIATELGYYNYEIGVMIEYVWFANRTNLIVKDVDFISFGLNDLTESVTGLSRNSNDKCFAVLDERVKQLLEESIYRARLVKPDIPIGFCGLHTNFAENLSFFKKSGGSFITCNSEFVPVAQTLLSEDIFKVDEYHKLCLVLRKIRDKKRGQK